MTPEMPSQTDVLVIGAGPTGLTLANLLGSMGVQVTLVERNQSTVQEPRAVSIDDESMRVMQAAGMVADVQAIVASGYGSIYMGPGDRIFATVKPASREYGFDKRNGFEQPALEALLRDKLARFANVSRHFSCELTGFTQDETGVAAELRSTDGGLKKIRARYLVGCDGARSLVRKSLGVQLEGSTFEEPWLIVDLHRTQNGGRHTEVRCTPERPSISLPGPNGVRRYEFMLHKGEDPVAAVQEPFVRALLASAGPDRDAPLRRVQVYTFHARMAERWRAGRVFLAGDAAHLTPPFAGQGMNSGLRDAHNLAWKLDEALRAGAEEALLESYQAERKPHAWSMIQLALWMGRVMMPRSALQGALIRTAFRLLGLYPPARDYFAQMRYKPKPRFEAGLIWPDGALGKSSVIGQMLPQPEVELPDRSRHLMDTLLPDAPIVLIHHPTPEIAVATEVQAELREAGAAIFGLTPEWQNPGEAEFPIFRDVSRLMSEPPYAGTLGQAILLRRDRYVAATKPVSEAHELLPALRVLRPAPDRPGPAPQSSVPLALDSVDSLSSAPSAASAPGRS